MFAIKICFQIVHKNGVYEDEAPATIYISIHLPSNKQHKLTVLFLFLGAQILRFPTI